jgi:uncharacterized protein (TIGR03000 family)
MKKMLRTFSIVLVCLAGTISTARAGGEYLQNPFLQSPCGPWAATAAFPTVKPPGWYTNTYSYSWHYPWYANYNYSHGPYANWLAGRGIAGYSNQKPTPPIPMPAQVAIVLPEDATLSFSGVVAGGSGSVRTFATPVLALNQDYGYEMTVEAVIDGKTHKLTKVVLVHAGESVEVKFDFPAAKEKETMPPPLKK